MGHFRMGHSWEAPRWRPLVGATIAQRDLLLDVGAGRWQSMQSWAEQSLRRERESWAQGEPLFRRPPRPPLSHARRPLSPSTLPSVSGCVQPRLLGRLSDVTPPQKTKTLSHTPDAPRNAAQAQTGCGWLCSTRLRSRRTTQSSSGGPATRRRSSPRCGTSNVTNLFGATAIRVAKGAIAGVYKPVGRFIPTTFIFSPCPRHRPSFSPTSPSAWTRQKRARSTYRRWRSQSRCCTPTRPISTSRCCSARPWSPLRSPTYNDFGMNLCFFGGVFCVFCVASLDRFFSPVLSCFSALCHLARAVRHILLGDHAHWMLMWCSQSDAVPDPRPADTRASFRAGSGWRHGRSSTSSRSSR